MRPQAHALAFAAFTAVAAAASKQHSEQAAAVIFRFARRGRAGARRGRRRTGARFGRFLPAAAPTSGLGLRRGRRRTGARFGRFLPAAAPVSGLRLRRRRRRTGCGLAAPSEIVLTAVVILIVMTAAVIVIAVILLEVHKRLLLGMVNACISRTIYYMRRKGIWL